MLQIIYKSWYIISDADLTPQSQICLCPKQCVLHKMQLDEEAQMEEMMQIPVKLKIYIYIKRENSTVP